MLYCDNEESNQSNNILIKPDNVTSNVKKILENFVLQFYAMHFFMQRTFTPKQQEIMLPCLLKI